MGSLRHSAETISRSDRSRRGTETKSSSLASIDTPGLWVRQDVLLNNKIWIRHLLLVISVGGSNRTQNRCHSRPMHRSHRIELRLLLTLFFIHLNCNTILYVKQAIFHPTLFSSPFMYPYTYIRLRALIGGSLSFVYRVLLVYALWRKMTDLYVIAIILLVLLTLLRLIFDCYGYFSGHIKHSLYYPFRSFEIKSMAEEITDLTFALIRNSVGLMLSAYLLKDMVHSIRSKETRRSESHRRQSSLSE